MQIHAVLYAILMIPTSIGSILANILLLLIFAYNLKLQTETSALTLNFCICDLLLGLTVIPFGVHNSLFGITNYTKDSFVCQSTAFFYMLLQLASVHSLTWSTIDKFTEICFPLHSAQLFTKKRTWAILCLLWIYCLINASFPFLGFGSYKYGERKFICAPNLQQSSKGYGVVLIAIGVIIPILIMCSLYIYIVKIARNQALRGTFACNDQHCYYVPANNYFRRTIVLISTAMCLLVCWMPYITISFYEMFTGNNIAPLTEVIATWLVLFTSALNPWVTIMSQKTKMKRQEQ
ncbi:histamine H2 receptor [Acipenser ruthenus]|uniref:histamine H2 receptor n=1 Tax=Acipenser ruthenus TaxID=7906 RepID=UPI002741793D|nr:histamine H2 receptor [Acipenser ruthenus]